MGSFLRRRRWPWHGTLLGYSENAEEPHECHLDSWERLREAEVIMAVILSGEGSSQAQDSLFLDVTPLLTGMETVGGVMTKLIERNTTTLVMRTPTPTMRAGKQLGVLVQRTCVVVLCRSQCYELALLPACLHEASPSCQFFALFWTCDLSINSVITLGH